jgi:hypothetical protein
MDLEHLLDVAVQVMDALAASHTKGLCIATSSRPIFSTRRDN